MAELTFNYGVMGCAKSANALMTRWDYLSCNRNVWLIKPSIDTRDNIITDGKTQTIIKSRVGISAVADVIHTDEHITVPKDIHAIICDEAQFLQPWQVDELYEITKERNIPVICYGLRTDFRTKLFPGSQRLFELADRLTELEKECGCGNRATISARFVDGKLVTEGEQIEIGGDEKYKALCYNCWKKLKRGNTND